MVLGRSYSPAIKHLFSPGVHPMGFKECSKRPGVPRVGSKWLSELSREQRHTWTIIFPAICLMTATTRGALFALEAGRSKNNTNHVMKGQMDLI